MSRLAQRIARRLIEERTSAGLTQEDVARRAHVSAQYVSRLERAVSDAPRRVELGKVAAVFGLTADDLMGLEDTPVADPSSDEDAVTLSDLERQIRRATGNREVSIGLARVVTRWDRVSASDRKLIEAAIEAALDGADDSPDEGAPPSE